MESIEDCQEPETVEELIECGPSYDFVIKNISHPDGTGMNWCRCEMIHTDQIKTGEGSSVKKAIENAWSAPNKTIEGWKP